jgi:predicted secreted protein
MHKAFGPWPFATSLRTAGMLTLLVAFCPAHGKPSAQAAELVLTEQDNGKTVAASVDQAILVNLRGNPTTGYTWLLSATNGDSVSATGPRTYTVDPGGGVGRGGTFSFPFSAVKPGQTVLSFDYERYSDPPSVAQTFTVTINVTAEPVLPTLSIELVQTNVVITWPIATSSGFFLEGTATLSPPQWAALNVVALPDGPNYKVILAAFGDSLFFRLRQ